MKVTHHRYHVKDCERIETLPVRPVCPVRVLDDDDHLCCTEKQRRRGGGQDDAKDFQMLQRRRRRRRCRFCHAGSAAKDPAPPEHEANLEQGARVATGSSGRDGQAQHNEEKELSERARGRVEEVPEIVRPTESTANNASTAGNNSIRVDSEINSPQSLSYYTQPISPINPDLDDVWDNIGMNKLCCIG